MPNQPDNNNLTPQGQFLVYQTEDGQPRIEVRLEGETVWLAQQGMATLFQTSRTNIVEHLKHIYEEGELDEAATHKDFLLVRLEGNRHVKRPIEYYNLDAIISVGYHVKSGVATKFLAPVRIPDSHNSPASLLFSFAASRETPFLFSPESSFHSRPSCSKISACASPAPPHLRAHLSTNTLDANQSSPHTRRLLRPSRHRRRLRPRRAVISTLIFSCPNLS